jgi:hypothetical protein
LLPLVTVTSFSAVNADISDAINGRVAAGHVQRAGNADRQRAAGAVDAMAAAAYKETAAAYKETAASADT